MPKLITHPPHQKSNETASPKYVLIYLLVRCTYIYCLSTNADLSVTFGLTCLATSFPSFAVASETRFAWDSGVFARSSPDG